MNKTKKSKTVYIAMGVDLLHPGHLNIIEQGRKYGDIIVGLMTDKALASYKRLPYMSYDQRKAVVENVKGVTKVVPQCTLDYRPNLNKLRPDYVLHGDDWKRGIQKPVRAQVIKTLKKWGGECIDIPYTKEFSSTQFNELIKDLGTTPQMRIKQLRRLMDAKPLIRGMEVHNGLSGLIVENTSVTKNHIMCDFDFMWLSSLTDSTAKGKPDIELVDSTSRMNTLHDVLESTTKPIIYDGDSGGNTDQLRYLVRTLERLGISAVIVEDKKGLKENSLLEVSTQKQESPKAFANKIAAAKKSCVTDDFLIIARIESLILGKGEADALKRARTYISAGVDGIMIHSKEKTPKEILAFCRTYKKLEKQVPLVVVPSTYDTITEKELQRAGVNIVIYANHLLRSAYPAMLKTAETILKNGRAHEASEKYCLPIKEVLQLIKKR